ncbi:hypothetical protein SLS60_010761 [Paraconiothyrium brasiliense]|uniref:Uncharacterized protein n=1 Tax=Paraconiothyrium brasiliense TaxID=300254 RepID=A0ABR3QLZ0_9PLEO
MASTIPNERRLRQITLATLLPAFPLIVASGVLSDKTSSWNGYFHHRSGPIIIHFGLIPTFFSAISSIVALKIKRDPLEKRTRLRTALWTLFDLILALMNLAVLITIWIFEPSNMNHHGDWMMLETYATVFLMSNMFIHAYLGLYHPVKSLSKHYCSGASKTKCPHCHGKLASVETVDTKSGEYSLLRGEDYLDEPEGDAPPIAGPIRLSTDSEA